MQELFIAFTNTALLRVADLGCFIQDPDPYFFNPDPDPGSRG
jgi:hypothetical protein